MSGTAVAPALRPVAETIENLPHCREMGFRVTGLEPGKATVRLDYDRRLAADPASGVLHGGAVTTLLDTVCGIATFSILDSDKTSIATLDLRIDYLKPATPGQPLFGFAEVYKRTANVAFVRGVAYQGGPGNPVANCVSTYMLGSVGFVVPRGEGRPGEGQGGTAPC
jgi:uncharacterized protein (TIGR00369 family)